MNKSDQVAIYPQFDKAWLFFNGLASVKIAGKWGYINKNGEVIIKPQFTDIKSFSFFSDDLSSVKFENGKWGYVDRNGAVVINPQFEDAYNFVNGVGYVTTGGKFGLIDKAGKYIWEPTK